MNINDFEKYVDSKIFARGKEYFADGLVDRLEEIDDGDYEAIVEGTDDYTVNVTIGDDGEISEHSCDCPYEFGDVCKHEVAVLLAIKKSMTKSMPKKARKSKSVKVKLKELLEAQPKEALVSVLYSLAEENRTLRQTLLLRFSTQDNEYDLCRKLIKEHIRRHIRGGYIEWSALRAAMTGAWEVLDRAEKVVQSDCIRAVKLCFIVISEVISILECCDDSNGETGEVLDACTEIVQKAALAGQSSLPKHSRDELFDLISDEAKKDIYKDWSDFSISFWETLVSFCGDPALYQKLWSSLESERKSAAVCHSYYGRALAWLQLQLLTQWDTEEKSNEFLVAHLHYNEFRRQAIYAAMEKGDYASALRYAQEGIAQDEPYEHYGSVREWRVALFEAYKAMGNIEKTRELAEYFVKYQHDGMDYYDVLKETTPKEKWPEALSELLRFFESEKFSSETYPKILIAEKDFDRLMMICRKAHWRIAEFGLIFPASYRGEVEEIYRTHILALANIASNRRMYQEVCHFLKGMGDVCGKAVMDKLALRIKAEHPRQPAFLDELSKLG